MAVTVANLITNVDTYIGDASTDRISQAERFQALTEATAWLIEELGNDHSVKTYDLEYLDTIHYYKVTNSVTDLLASADLRRGIENHWKTASPKSSRDIAEDIGQQSNEFAWAVERRNDNTFIVVNLEPEETADYVASFDSLTSDGGTWEADTTNSDALNVTADSVEYKEGSGSINFDIDVSQSGNNRATIFNDSVSSQNLTEFEDLGSWLFELYIPDVTNITSITLYWGSSDSAYWSATASTDIDGAVFSDGWNTIKIDWENATMISSPDVAAIDYIRFDLNYGVSQVDDTDFRLDNLRIANPETLTFYYVTWNVGETAGGTEISAFTASTDVPFFSGKYDQYRYAVAHKAASILFFTLRLRDEALTEEREALSQVDRIRDIIPDSKVPETHNFKVMGVNLTQSNRRRRFRL